MPRNTIRTACCFIFHYKNVHTKFNHCSLSIALTVGNDPEIGKNNGFCLKFAPLLEIVSLEYCKKPHRKILGFRKVMSNF